MIKVIIEDVEYNLIDSWSQMKLKKYYEFKNINTDPLDENDIMVKLISVLGDIPVNVLEEIPYSDLIQLYAKIDFIKENINEDEIKFEFEFENKKFKLTKNLSKMSTRQFIDLDYLSKNNSDEDLPRLMAILYREEIDGKPKKYISEDLDDEAEFMLEHMPISFALSAMLFFFVFGMNCSEYTQDFLVNQTKS